MTRTTKAALVIGIAALMAGCNTNSGTTVSIGNMTFGGPSGFTGLATFNCDGEPLRISGDGSTINLVDVGTYLSGGPLIYTGPVGDLTISFQPDYSAMTFSSSITGARYCVRV